MADNHGFEVLREQDIPEINSHVRLLRHTKTGAQVLSVENEDENKSFGVSFRTPPPDDTGVPHILEHSVLSGSRKYPVKDLFAELIKGSMATFLNAMTGPDQTMYPVASQNLQDFYNLVDVYLDVVFFPKLAKETLMQEGWHHELNELEEEMVYRGIVFNEMKGFYSSPEMILYLERLPRLFPDTPYARNEGGDPRAIPDLTYEDFLNFHRTYYHPSNALIFFAGDDDPEQRLKIVGEYLDQFETLDVDSRIPPATRFDAPQTSELPYPVQPGDDSGKAFVDISWALPEPHDVELTFGLQMLSHILMGTPASPLRKALIDSGLGENTMGGNLDSGRQQMVFNVGLKGVALDQTKDVETFVMDTLTQLVAEGIDPKTVEASINTVEFQLREYNTGGFPRGLAMMFTALTTWTHDGDPFQPLAFEAPLNAIKNRVESENRYFEDLIQTFLIDNPHRSTLVLIPDDALVERLRREEKIRIDSERMEMDEEKIREIIEQTRQLQEMQRTPNPPEALEKLPMLTLADLEREVKVIPLDEQSLNGVKTLFHDLFTNGIFYLDLAFDLSVIPQELLPYLSLFGRALLEMGTKQESFVEFTQRIGSKTGGINSSRLSGHVWDSDETTFQFVLRGKSTIAQVAEMLDILRDMLLSVSFDDKERFRQIALKSKAMRESQLIPNGMGVILQRMNSGYHLPGWFDEHTGGTQQLFFVRDLLARIETDWERIRTALQRIQSLLFTKANLLVNVTVDADSWSQVRSDVANFVSALPAGTGERHVWSPTFRPVAEGLTVPAQVNYVGKAANLYDLGYELDGSINVITKSLRIGYLYNRIRAQGGAYGMTANFSLSSGVLRLGSYRDPNLVNTLMVYDGMASYLSNLDMSEKELTQAIVGAVGTLDAYQLPDAKGYTSMIRYLTNMTDETRQRIRDEVLSTTVADFRHFGDVLAAFDSKGVPVVMGSEDAIKAADQELDLGLKMTKVL